MVIAVTNHHNSSAFLSRPLRAAGFLCPLWLGWSHGRGLQDAQSHKDWWSYSAFHQLCGLSNLLTLSEPLFANSQRGPLKGGYLP